MSKKPEINAGNNIAALMNGIINATTGQQRHVNGAHAKHVKNTAIARQQTLGRVRGKAMSANQARYKPK